MVADRRLLLLLVALLWNCRPGAAGPVKRELSALDLLHLGRFGPVSGLASHPVFAHLGLASRQSVGFVGILARSGLLAPGALRLAGGEPFVLGGLYPGPPVHVVDPYFLYLVANHARYLPPGLGPRGIYGSTGLPRPAPPGVSAYRGKE